MRGEKLKIDKNPSDPVSAARNHVFTVRRCCWQSSIILKILFSAWDIDSMSSVLIILTTCCLPYHGAPWAANRVSWVLSARFWLHHNNPPGSWDTLDTPGSPEHLRSITQWPIRGTAHLFPSLTRISCWTFLKDPLSNSSFPPQQSRDQ